MTNIIKKMANYTIALTKHAAGGFKNVSEEVYEQRKAICESCPLLFNGECGLCGCPVESKALWATEACPDKKWFSDDPEVKIAQDENFDIKKGTVSQVSANSPYSKSGCSSCKKRKG